MIAGGQKHFGGMYAWQIGGTIQNRIGGEVEKKGRIQQRSA